MSSAAIFVRRLKGWYSEDAAKTDGIAVAVTCKVKRLVRLLTLTL